MTNKAACAWCKAKIDRHGDSRGKPPRLVGFANRTDVEHVCEACYETACKQKVPGTFP